MWLTLTWATCTNFTEKLHRCGGVSIEDKLLTFVRQYIKAELSASVNNLLIFHIFRYILKRNNWNPFFSWNVLYYTDLFLPNKENRLLTTNQLFICKIYLRSTCFNHGSNILSAVKNSSRCCRSKNNWKTKQKLKKDLFMRTF